MIQDEAAERALLGALMLDRRVVWPVAERVRAGDFYQPAHEHIFKAVLSLAEADRSTDVIAVTDWLREAHQLRGNLHAAYLHTLTSEVPTPSAAPGYAEIVRRIARRRNLATALVRAEAITMAEGDADEAGDPVEAVRSLIEELDRDAITASDLAADGLADLVAEVESEATFVKTPWLEVDRYLGGWRRGALYVVGARPGVGKSAFALNAAAQLAQYGPVGFVTLEMPTLEVNRRLVSSLGEVSMGALLSHHMTKTDWDGFRQASALIGKLMLHIRDDVEHIDDVVSFARSLHRKGKMQGLVIDYLQLMRGGKAESRQHEVAGMSRRLKRLAVALDIPIIALSQLNRQVTGRVKGQVQGPQLSDLRESGAIEQDADAVLLLHRDGDGGKSADLKVSIAKNRHGRQGDVSLRWEGQYARAVSKGWTPLDLDQEGGQ